MSSLAALPPRRTIEKAIEVLIAVCDAIDGDENLEGDDPAEEDDWSG